MLVIHPPNTPFSHIQIIPKVSPERSVVGEETFPPVIFQRLSYSQRAEKNMAAPYNYHASTSTASLANNTSGTTFAAKARAAELNAVRSQKAAKEMEVDDEVPLIAPVALGALKFTRPRNRGRVWKALNLEELANQPLEGQETESEHPRSPAPLNHEVIQATNCSSREVGGGEMSYNNQADSQSLYQQTTQAFPYQDPLISSQPQKLEKSATNHGLGGWNPEMSLARPVGQDGYSQALNGHLTPQPPPRGTSALGHDFHSTQNQDAEIEGRSMSSLPLQQGSKNLEDDSRGQPRLNSMEERKLTRLGVLPALQPTEGGSLPTEKYQDDPFTESTQLMRSRLYSPHGINQSYALNGSAAHVLPPMARGIMNNEFRFPQSYQTPHGVIPQQSIPKIGQGQPNVPNNGPRANPYPRDPMPYSSFSISSKKDLLLRNLQDVVESSKTQGNLPISTRTVLYDPVAHDVGKQVQPSPTETAFKRAQADEAPSRTSTGTGSLTLPQVGKELLKASDPLPWTDRPVSIHNSTSPTAPQANFPMLTQLPSTQIIPPGLGYVNPNIWARGSEELLGRHAVEEPQLWRNHDSRRGGEFQARLGQINLDYELSKKAHRPNLASDTNAIEQLALPLKFRSHPHGEFQYQPHPLRTKIITPAQVATGSMLPLLNTLTSYVDNTNPGYFNRYARVPEWCIDKSQGANQSFFGSDWGVPPSRVGRDPRYRPTFHEGRYTVFEELDRRGGRDSGRRFG